MSEIDFNSPTSDLRNQTSSVSSDEENAPKEEISSEEKSHEKKLEAEIKKSAELSRKALYLQADLANAQRQAERRIAEARDEASIRYVEELISVKEDLERALVVVSEPKQLTALTEGLGMLLSKIDSFLDGEEVRRIDVSKGAELDTRYHEVVAYSEQPGNKDGSIVSVVRNGYTLRGKVIKPALVEVARAKKRELGQKEISLSDAKKEIST